MKNRNDIMVLFKYFPRLFYHLYKHSAWPYKFSLLKLLKFTPILILEKIERDYSSNSLTF